MTPAANWFFLSSATLSATCLFLIAVLVRFGKDYIHKIWLLFNSAVLIWGAGSTIIGTISKAIFFSYNIWIISSLGATFIPVFLLHMANALTKRNNDIFLPFSYGQAILFAALLVFYPNALITPTMHLYKEQFLTPSLGRFYWLWFSGWFITVSYAHAILIKFYLTHPEGKTKHIEFLLLGILFGFVSGTINFFHYSQTSYFQFSNIGIAIYCFIVSYAVLRHRMLGIEIIFQKGLSYSLLLIIILCIYLAIALGTEWCFRGLVGYHSMYSNFLSTLIIALLFNPLRTRMQNITDRMIFGKTAKEIVNENMRLRYEIERSERLKTATTLSLGLAHEIKNPITTIKTFAEFLPQKYTDKDFVNRFSKIIPAEVDRINSIIHKLLDFSKPTPPVFKNVNISYLISDILIFLSSDFLKNKIKVSEDFKDTNLEIKADANQIKQALFNLLNNSKEAMPRGGNIVIKTSLADGNFVLIEILDSGDGIESEKIKHVFDPFFTTKDEGTGLGLSICYQIIKKHFGEIEITSEVNRGTTVRILLPRAG